MTASKHLCVFLSMQVVPESQMSLGENEKNTAPYLLPAPSAPAQVKEICTCIYCILDV